MPGFSRYNADTTTWLSYQFVPKSQLKLPAGITGTRNPLGCWCQRALIDCSIDSIAMEVCGGDTRMAAGGCDKGDVTVDENGVYLFNDATKVGDAAKVR